MRTFKICFVFGLALAVMSAGIIPAAADQIPPRTPDTVPGKEYSNAPDETAGGVFDPHQNIWWDGTGNAGNTFDYTNGLPVALQDMYYVDALANFRDHYYYRVARDEVTMLVSLQGERRIRYTASAHHVPVHGTPPKIGVWASPNQINSSWPPDDVDGLEIWGPDGSSGDDANRFSLIFDPQPDGHDDVPSSKVSVWSWDPNTNSATPYIYTIDIATAVGQLDLVKKIDVDAMMIYDNQDDATFEFEGDAQTPADSIMFSIAPVYDDQNQLVFDGGEIWLWDYGGPGSTAQFLMHGNETWNTGHSVQGHFGGVNEENINALEGVPEPSTFALSTLALLGLVGWGRRRTR